MCVPLITQPLQLVRRLVPIHRFHLTSRMAVVKPSGLPKSVRNGSLIEAFGGVFVLSLCSLEFPLV